MTNQDRKRAPIEIGGDRVSVAVLPEAQQRYPHLVRPARNLRPLGLGPYVGLLRNAEPAVAIPLPTGRIRVTAARRRHGWIYQQGRARPHLTRTAAKPATRRVAAQVGP